MDNNHSINEDFVINRSIKSSYPLSFAGYGGQKVLVSVLCKRLGVPWSMARTRSRTIRILWFMNEMGRGWYSLNQMQNIGSGQFNHLKYSLPDGVKDGLLDVMEVSGRFRYRINDLGLAMLLEAEKFVIEEMDRSLEKIRKFKEGSGKVIGRPKGSKNGIKPQ